MVSQNVDYTRKRGLEAWLGNPSAEGTILNAKLKSYRALHTKEARSGFGGICDGPTLPMNPDLRVQAGVLATAAGAQGHCQLCSQGLALAACDLNNFTVIN